MANIGQPSEETPIMPLIRSATHADIPAIVTLNAAFVDMTSPMDADRCRHLMSLAAWSLMAENDGEVVGFVFAMRDGARYDNGNFAWFSERLQDFVYIDRVVVGDRGRGQGLGQRLYDAICDAARPAGCRTMAAEMNVAPPNIASLNFHKARGFRELGTRILEKGVTVSMQAADI